LLTIKSLVCSTHQSDGSLAILSNFKLEGSTQDPVGNVKIWEAARATSAATRFFDPIKIGDFKLGHVDGAFGNNNPIRTVWSQANHLWVRERNPPEFFVLSIGTGEATRPGIGGGWSSIIRTLIKIATQTEQTADEFSDDHRDLIQDEMLYRFNVAHGLETVHLDEYKHMNMIAGATKTYLNRPATEDVLARCVRKLKILTQCNYLSPASYYQSIR